MTDQRPEGQDAATGYIKLPAKTYVCAEHRKMWDSRSPALRFSYTTEAMPR